jgi:hypothetical protein
MSPRTLARLVARFALAFAVPALPASASVIVVAPSGGDFISIKDAIAAALEGDTILVKPGADASGFPLVDGKSLTIVGDAPAGVDIDVTIAVWNLAAGQQVTLRNLSMGQTTLSSNAGSVWIEDCSYQGSILSVDTFGCFFVTEDPLGHAGLSVLECASVTLVRCSFVGGDGSDGYVTGGMSAGLSTDGGPGVRTQSSTVAVYDSTLRGGTGGGGVAACEFQGDGGAGFAMGIVNPLYPDLGSKLLLSGCTLVGGHAGIGVPGDGVEGGPLDDIQVLDCDVQLDPGAVAFDTAPGTLTLFSGTARSFALSSPVREGQVGDISIQGVQGDVVGFFWSFSSGSLPMPGKSGWWLPSVSMFAGPFVLGAIPNADGSWLLHFTAPHLVPAAESQTFLMQGLFKSASGLTLGSGTAFTLVDASF